jgi:hypothetical protein
MNGYGCRQNSCIAFPGIEKSGESGHMLVARRERKLTRDLDRSFALLLLFRRRASTQAGEGHLLQVWNGKQKYHTNIRLHTSVVPLLKKIIYIYIINNKSLPYTRSRTELFSWVTNSTSSRRSLTLINKVAQTGSPSKITGCCILQSYLSEKAFYLEHTQKAVSAISAFYKTTILTPKIWLYDLFCYLSKLFCKEKW